jgi:hypothetical protein
MVVICNVIIETFGNIPNGHMEASFVIHSINNKKFSLDSLRYWWISFSMTFMPNPLPTKYALSLWNPILIYITIA